MKVERLRGRTTESRHEVHVAVVDASGRLVARAGDPDLVTFWRSAAKPFQAAPLVEDGVVAAFRVTTEELALACASHSSEPRQVELVRGFLARIGCRETDLLCGPHTPLSDAVAQEYRARGVTLTAVHSNCSGKHTGMLALARHHGWPTADYVAAGHPVQQRCLTEVSRWTGIAAPEIATGIDGCGVVCFALPLSAMARAYAALGAPDAGPAAQAIVAAMLQHPELIAGEGRPCTVLMRIYPGLVIAKLGAEGVYSALLVKEGLGITLKVADGHVTAAALALGAVLAELGLGAPPAELAPRPIRNSRGLVVGEMRVNGGLAR
jgi:L-asparaginase II